jgi:hypothetical protein
MRTGQPGSVPNPRAAVPFRFGYIISGPTDIFSSVSCSLVLAVSGLMFLSSILYSGP